MKKQKRACLVLAFVLETGREIWRKEALVAGLEKKHSENSFASSTPATDGRQLYVTFLDYPKIRFFSYRLNGTISWEVSPGNLHSKHGFCSSPVLHENLVILNEDQDVDGYLFASNKETGKEAWRTPRPNQTRFYCKPVIVTDPLRPGKSQLVFSGSKCLPVTIRKQENCFGFCKVLQNSMLQVWFREKMEFFFCQQDSRNTISWALNRMGEAPSTRTMRLAHTTF